MWLLRMKLIRMKGCTHQAMSLCIGVVDSHRKQYYNNLNPSHSDLKISDLKRQLKLLEMACNQFLTCLIFPIKISSKAQQEH